MKKIVLFLSSLFTLTMVQAQVVDLSGESNVLYGTSANTSEELDLGWEVICNAATSTDIKCSATVIQMVTGAKYQYCWGAACSPWISANNSLPEIVTMAAQESNSSFHIKYRHYGYAGQSIVRFCWYDANNTADIFCYDVNFCVDAEGGCVVDVQEVVTSASIAQISPNPANEMASIAFSFSTKPSDAQLVVYNMVGEMVASYPINQRQGQIRIQARDLNSGIYFCSLVHEGKKLETKRLVVNH
jgi:Secretion system C-terminal sorting domain